MKSQSTAVMQRRLAPAKGLDYFPTPPWATRAFMREVLQADQWPKGFYNAWEPACGQGHMSFVLSEFFHSVRMSDVHDYGSGFEVGSFTGQGLDVAATAPVDWIITNPPFNLALEFAERGLAEAKVGVALLLRLAWVEGGERYKRLFSKNSPSIIAQYCDRVPMVAGRWDPAASSATAYAWFVWRGLSAKPNHTEFRWIAPGAKDRNHTSDDVKRWAT